jgi:hypothetical protein
MATVRTPFHWGLLTVLLLLLVSFPSFATYYWLTLMIFMCIFVINTLGLHILLGCAGQISLGQSAFMAVGAYSSVILTTTLHLPFWVAVFIERIKVMFLPLVALLIPLIRFFPPSFRWRVRSRIYRWYRNLEEVDLRGRQSTSLDEIKSWITELAKIEREVMRVSVPLSYAGELYNLRTHIAHVQESLRKTEAVLRGEGNTSTGKPEG